MPLYDKSPQAVISYVLDWRNRARRERLKKETIWNECWELYRGKQDFSAKEDWQSQIVMPKAFNSVKQATSIVKRLLSLSQRPWSVLPVDNDNPQQAIRAEQMERLTRQFLELANYKQEFAIGLECAFIMGLGVWKIWWGSESRTRRVVDTIPGIEGVGNQQAIVPQKSTEGKLFIRAVDPYNFYWLPGSKFNRWVGTIEETEIPKWELMQMAEEGLFDSEIIKNLSTMWLPEERTKANRRFDEVQPRSSAPNEDSGMVKLTEYWGPIVMDGELLYEQAHILIANEDKILYPSTPEEDAANPYWAGRPPYVAFSPLTLPFRTDGVGLIEMVRDIDKGINQITNLGMDTELFRLLPVFEVVPEAFENAEDFETGMHPGKIFRRNQQFMNTPGIMPVQFNAVGQDAIQMAAILDRAHQEGALISEIQQALPRYRGVQTATETEAKQLAQDSFFGGMATDIEEQALQPIVELSMDLIMQFIDTARDPRVASILGTDAYVLAGMSKEQIYEAVTGDFTIRVTGISEQIEKMTMLENLVQFMNIIGQNGQAWLPFIRQDVLLKKIMTAFRPSIDDIDDILETPENAAAKQQAMVAAQNMGQLLQHGRAVAQQGQDAAQAEVESGQRDAEIENQQTQGMAQLVSALSGAGAGGPGGAPPTDGVG